MQCKCVKCGERYEADDNLKIELARFHLAHRQAIPKVSPWICDKCWESFKPELPKLMPK